VTQLLDPSTELQPVMTPFGPTLLKRRFALRLQMVHSRLLVTNV